MNDKAGRLPADIASCHALINQLMEELEETRRKLAVYVENERREMEHRYGKGVTAAHLLSFGQHIERMHDRRRSGKK
jgi:hypothetical protein